MTTNAPLQEKSEGRIDLFEHARECDHGCSVAFPAFACYHAGRRGLPAVIPVSRSTLAWEDDD